MTSRPLRRFPAALLPLALLAGCGDSPTPTPGDGDDVELGRFAAPVALPALGLGEVAERATSELWVHGGYAYTGTRTLANVVGNVIKVWSVAGAAPVLVDSVTVPGPPVSERVARHPGDHEHGEGESAGPNRIADLQVSDDGRLLVAATEGGPGSIVVYSLEDPAHPRLLSRFAPATLDPGVHTAEVARVNGRLYAFLSVDPRHDLVPPKLVIVDLGDPSAPREVWSREMGRPVQHDVFVRDGVLFTALWDDGVGIWDLGGAGRGGSVENPVLVSTLQTEGGSAHNLWWLHDRATGSRRWLLVGDERSEGGEYRGDVHVVDVRNLAAPREVAFFHVEGAGAHNFSVDEQRGILYAAFYNAGVRALDVRGDLGACAAAQRAPDGRCDLGRMNREAGRGLAGTGRPVYVWGVHLQGGALYASDMLNGLWKLDATPLQ